MENLDVVVLRTLQGWRAAGRHALMATVVRTWGSSPRPVGSIMALCEDGAVVGSVSGGCIEDDLIDRHTRAYAQAGVAADGAEHRIPSGPPSFVKYGVSADEAHRFGLPCGGTLELLLEYDPDPTLLAELIAHLAAGRLVQRTVRLSDGAVTLAPTQAPEELAVDALQLTNTFGPEYRMLLIGAGVLAEYVATMALFNDFAVTVCDPRDAYLGTWSVAGVQITQEMPDDAVRALKPDPRTCIVALSHDPKLDDMALLEALHSPAFYVGAIGSRRNTDSRRQRLIAHFDETEESMDRLHAPVGIYIGSKTPAEIAVSVMAEILAVKNGVPLPRALSVAAAKAAVA